MKVQCVFEFKRVKSDSDAGQQIIEDMLTSCENMRIAFNANNLYMKLLTEGDETARSKKEKNK